MDEKENSRNRLEHPEEAKASTCSGDAAESSDSFRCSICLELLYKPVVLGCGHVSCFWCIHAAMNGSRESHCPICRRPYIHFPSICELLHFLLLTTNNVEYKRREKQALEEENRTGYFSPEIPDHAARKRVNCEEPSPPECALHSFEINSCDNGADTVECATPHSNDMVVPEAHCLQRANGSNKMPVGEKSFQLPGLQEEACRVVSLADVLCMMCKKLLVQPVVLNCGHVCCMSCLDEPVEGSLICHECQSPHPGGLPKVCLELDHFLEDQFPSEYAFRRKEMQFKLVDHCQNDFVTCDTVAKKQGGNSSSCSIKYDFASLNDRAPDVNVGVGCDSCGMYPILGKWYRCKDCTEKIGFDLCEGCYNTCSKLPGRFNQQHTAEHRLVLVNPGKLRGLLYRLAFGDGTVILAPSNDEQEDG